MTFQGRVIPKPISIAIIGISSITSHLLAHAFTSRPGFVVIGCLSSTEDAVRTVSIKRPDIAVINAVEESESFSAMAVLEKFIEMQSSVRSIVLTSHSAPEKVISYFYAQARGIISSIESDFAILCKCVSSVSAGQIWANSEQLDCLVSSLKPTRDRRIVNSAGVAILSEREQEVLDLLAEGMSNRELAATLKLSGHTVKNHIFHIFDKLGVSNRTEAVLYAINGRTRGEQQSNQVSSVPYEVKRMA